MSVNTILNDLVESLPDIYGGFICEPHQGIVASQLSLIGSEQDCQEIFSKVEKIFLMASAHYTDIKRLKFCYETTILLAYPLSDGRWLFLTHAESVAPGMVQMTVGVALNALMEDSGATDIDNSAKVVKEDESVDEQVINLDTSLAPGGELFEPMEKIKKVLIKTLGPIGEIILEDALESWSKKVSPTLANITELYPFLEEEVDDAEQYSKFKELLGSM